MSSGSPSKAVAGSDHDPQEAKLRAQRNEKDIEVKPGAVAEEPALLVFAVEGVPENEQLDQQRAEIESLKNEMKYIAANQNHVEGKYHNENNENASTDINVGETKISPSSTKKSTWKKICVALVLLAIGGGVAGYILSKQATTEKGPEDGTSAPSSSPTDGRNVPSGSPTEFQRLMGPSEEDCEAMSNGMAVENQDSFSSERYSVDFEVTLAFATDEVNWRNAFATALQSTLIPRLAGCQSPTTRRLRERIANTAQEGSQQRLLQSQLPDYRLANGLISNTTVSDDRCGDTANSLCFKVNVVMDLWLARDNVEEFEISDFIADTLGQSLVTILNLQVLISSVVLIRDSPLSIITPSATATQSSDHTCNPFICSGGALVVPDGVASRAIDGNTDGNYFSGSISHTFTQVDAWWKVTGIAGPVSTVKVWNRLDCCTEMLEGSIVVLRDVNGAVIATQIISGIEESYTLDFGSVSRVAEVQIQKAGIGNVMLAEVEVLGSADESLLSASSVASQSSGLSCGPCITANTGSGPDVAIDGNTDGSYPDGSVTHTFSQVDPWLLISLGLTATVKKIVVWNRTDCCGDRLVGAKIELLDSSDAVLHTETITSSSASTTFDIPAVADVTAIRVRLETGDQYMPLSVAEVEAFGQVQS